MMGGVRPDLGQVDRKLQPYFLVMTTDAGANVAAGATATLSTIIDTRGTLVVDCIRAHCRTTATLDTDFQSGNPIPGNGQDAWGATIAGLPSLALTRWNLRTVDYQWSNVPIRGDLLVGGSMDNWWTVRPALAGGSTLYIDFTNDSAIALIPALLLVGHWRLN